MSLPVTHSVVERGMKIGRTDEYMTREVCTVVRANHALIDGLVPVHSVCHYLSN